MALIINRVARGLVSFFGGKTAAQPPQAVAPEIRCIVDLSKFIAHGSMEEVNELSTVIAGGGAGTGFYGGVSGINLVVPQNQTWLVIDHSAVSQGFLGAGTEATAAAAYRTTTGFDFLLGPFTPNAVANQRPATFAAKVPFLLGPGDQLGVYLMHSVVGVAYQYRLTSRFMRLDI